MKLWRWSASDPATGSGRRFFTGTKEHAQTFRYVQIQQGLHLSDLLHIDVPTSKNDLVNWLNEWAANEQ